MAANESSKSKLVALGAESEAQAARIAALEGRGDVTAMVAEIKAGQKRIEEALLGLAKVLPTAMLSRPVPLKADEVKLILRDNPGAKFRVISAKPRSPVKENEVVEALMHFANVAQFASHVDGGTFAVIAA